MIAANAPHSATPKNLDPKPWINGHGVRIRNGVEGLNRNVFAPRPEYSQNREDYP